jgi:hypothetical protein
MAINVGEELVWATLYHVKRREAVYSTPFYVAHAKDGMRCTYF